MQSLAILSEVHMMGYGTDKGTLPFEEILWLLWQHDSELAIYVNICGSTQQNG